MFRFLTRLFTQTPANPEPAATSASFRVPTGSQVMLPGTDRGYFIEVHGESFYQEGLRDLWETIQPDRECHVMLFSEPSNPHDSNAVLVISESLQRLGHLTREDAARYQQLLLQIEARDQVGSCRAKLIGGGRGKSWGIVLDLLPPTKMAEQLGLTYKRVAGAQTTA